MRPGGRAPGCLGRRPTDHFPISPWYTASIMAKKALSLDTKLKDVLRAYRDSFSMKTYSEENDDPDPLMDVFGITPDRKRENRQYWGRELGMCWQLLVTNALSHHCKGYAPAIKLG